MGQFAKVVERWVTYLKVLSQRGAATLAASLSLDACRVSIVVYHVTASPVHCTGTLLLLLWQPVGHVHTHGDNICAAAYQADHHGILRMWKSA